MAKQEPYFAFIDGDMPVYSACEESERENESFEYCKAQYSELILNQFIELQSWFNSPIRGKEIDLTSFQVYIGSDDYSNYRYKVDPEYKIQRKGKPKPKYFFELKEWLVAEYGAIYVTGKEADDQVSIDAVKYGNNAIIVGGDKDYRMVEGCWHFEPNKGIPPYYVEAPGCLLKLRMLTGNWREFGTGNLWFWYQMIIGDMTDGIPGLPRKGHAFAWKFLQERVGSGNILNIPGDVKQLYIDAGMEERFEINARLLWIQNYEDDNEKEAPWLSLEP